MFTKLKRRLILLYGVTSSIILSIIILGVSVLNYRQNNDQEKVLFGKNAEQIVEKVRSDNIINNAWMLQVQIENDYIVIVEENKKRLSAFNQTEKKDIDRLITRLKELAATEGVNTDRKPLYSRVEKTSVFPFNIHTGESYLGIATVIPKNSGWLTIMVISGNGRRSDAQVGQLLLFMLIDLIGVAALFLISTLYIGRVIKPLEEGQQKQIAFIAAASHELRSPLTVIKTGVTAIREDITKADQFLPHVEGECTRMTRLINDMLLLATADTKTWNLKMELMDMDTLLIECYDMICSCLNEKQTEITLELPEERLSLVNGDRERIKQILTILLDNSMSHTPKNASIIVRAYNQKRYVVIEVEDHGKGIPEVEKKLVFERFYRGDQSRNEKKHFGLGLSIAKELAELHQGDIQVRDTPGGGATFVFRLPVA